MVDIANACKSFDSSCSVVHFPVLISPSYMLCKCTLGLKGNRRPWVDLRGNGSTYGNVDRNRRPEGGWER